MKARKITSLAARGLAVAVVYLAVWMACSSLLSFGLPSLPADQMAEALRGMLIVAAVDAIVVALIVRGSRRHGWSLAAWLAFSTFGVITMMSVSQAVYFGAPLGITPRMIPGLVLPDLATWLVVSPLAVLILGRWKPPAAAAGEGEAVEAEAGAGRGGLGLAALPAGQWAWKLPVIALAYLVLYFGFGLLIAWQDPALRSMYNAEAHPAIFSPIPLYPFQVLQALLWAAFAWPVIRLTRGRPWQAALIVGLLLAWMLAGPRTEPRQCRLAPSAPQVPLPYGTRRGSLLPERGRKTW